VHFAEFLNGGYPDRLAFLMPPTCVGLRYGHLSRLYRLEAFLGSVESPTCGLAAPPTAQDQATDLPMALNSLTD
jgi:hypothetical protein